jgi:hypothetical protein
VIKNFCPFIHRNNDHTKKILSAFESCTLSKTKRILLISETERILLVAENCTLSAAKRYKSQPSRVYPLNGREQPSWLRVYTLNGTEEGGFRSTVKSVHP